MVTVLTIINSPKDGATLKNERSDADIHMHALELLINNVIGCMQTIVIIRKIPCVLLVMLPAA
jgi:hypothetical protein